MAFYNGQQQHPLLPRQPESLASARQNSDTTESFSILTPQRSCTHSSSLQLDDQEWILFSPQLVRERDDENENDEQDDDVESIDVLDAAGDTAGGPTGSALPGGAGATGSRTPLAFPHHDGSGMFLDSVDLVERVHAWRVNQSQHVEQELKRVERKFGYHSMSSTSLPSYETDISANISTHSAEPQQQQQPPQESLWSYVRGLIGFNDQVLDIIFGEFAEDNVDANAATMDDPLAESTTSTSTATASHYTVRKTTDELLLENELYNSCFVPESSHFTRSFETGPADWDMNLISRIFADLHMPLASELSFFRYLGHQILSLTRHDRPFRPPSSLEQHSAAYLNHPAHFWDPPTSLDRFWDTSSTSTPVW